MSLEEFTFNLPALNGTFEAGIALSKEAEIDAADRLIVITMRPNPKWEEGTSDKSVKKFISLTPPETVKYTLLYLYNSLKATNTDETMCKLMLAGATILLKTGNITYTTTTSGKVPDGSWNFGNSGGVTKEMITAERIKFIEQAIAKPELQKAASIIVGTKINWFKENHHTGQGKNGGAFTKKVIQAMLNTPATEQIIKFVHRLGHWASTRSVLRQIGIKHILETTPVFNGECTLAPTDDIGLRMKAAPAGTARMAVSYNLAKKMLAHPASVFLPNTTKLDDLPTVYAKVIDAPAKYHFGAAYLCGAREKYDDQDYEPCLGRTGTFGNTFYPASTLMKSPHAAAYQNASDYDQEFESQLKAFKADRMKQHKAKMEAFKKVGGGSGYDYSSICRKYDVTPNGDAVQVLAAMAEAARIAAEKEKEKEKEKKKDEEAAHGSGHKSDEEDL